MSSVKSAASVSQWFHLRPPHRRAAHCPMVEAHRVERGERQGARLQNECYFRPSRWHPARGVNVSLEPARSRLALTANPCRAV